MGKKIYPYLNFTTTDLFDRASLVGDKINNSPTDVDFTNISLSNIASVLAESSFALSELAQSTNINQWSWFSPRNFGILSNEIISTINPPYKIGDFAGYNHLAIEPTTSDVPTSLSGRAGLSSSVPFELNLGELDYLDIGSMTKVRSILKEGATTLATDYELISNSSNDGTNAFLDVQIDYTIPSGWTSDKTLTIELALVDSANTFIANYIVSSFTIPFTILNDPEIVGEAVGLSEGGWDLAEVQWNTLTSLVNVGTTPSFAMYDTNLFIDGVRFTGTSSVYIYKGADVPQYLGDYSLALADETISGTVPFQVDYNDTVVLEFRQQGN